jgi:hypothetical protein
VAAKEHSVSGTSLKVTLAETWPEMVSCAVRVRGVNDKITEDTLQLLFENEKRSGGGPIEEVFIDKQSGTAAITFESREGWRHSLKIVLTVFLEMWHIMLNSEEQVISFVTDYHAVSELFSLRVVECRVNEIFTSLLNVY